MTYQKRPSEINHVLLNLLSDLKLDDFNKKFSILEISHVWKKTIGNDILNHCKIEKYCDKVLYIKVENSVWRNELFLKRKSIIQLLNNNLKNIEINEIIFTL